MAFLHINAIFSAFDKNGDNLIDLDEFRLICRGLFRSDRGVVYGLPEQQLKEVFEVFDLNADGYIDKEEFIFCWYNWFKYIIHPRCVLMVVEIQNDLVNGVLSFSQAPEKVSFIELINVLQSFMEFEHIYYLMDWHPTNHISFYDNVMLWPFHESSPIRQEDAQLYDTVIFALPEPMKQLLLPKHCVENTFGSELHQDLRIMENSTRIHLGTVPDKDCHTPFRTGGDIKDSPFHAGLQKQQITDIYLCGITYDIIVAETAFDALELGYRTVIIDDACLGLSEEDIEKTRAQVISKNGIIAHSSQIKNFVEGKDRRPELGYSLAMAIKNRRKEKESVTYDL